MSEPTAVPPGLLAAMLDEQRRAWRNGERKLVESFLLRVPELSRDHASQLDLIYNEIVLREEAGERPTHQEYLQRFPDLREELALQFEVDRALNMELLTAEQKPPAAPFTGVRFPSIPGYEMVAILGRGKRGIVYKARHVATGRLDALKIILSGFNVGATKSYHAEANAWMRFKNPHIVSILDISVHDGRLVVAMELLERSLAVRIAGDDPVPPRQAAEWLEKLARTIHEVHQRGLAHRNLTSANVLLGPGDALKLTDFGMDPGEVPSDKAPGWLPEDSTTDALPRGADADITALGVILYEMLTGKPPGSFETPPRLPRDLESICQSCLNENPRRRYASAAALAADLNAYLNGERIRAPRARGRGRVVAGIGFVWLTIATFALMAIVLSRMFLPTSAAALPAALALGVLGFALGYWWSNSRSRSQIMQLQEEQSAAQRKTQRLAMLFDLCNRLARAADILPLVVETARWLVDAEQAVVFHVDAERRELWSRSNNNEIRVPIGGGIVGTVAKHGEPIFLADPFADARFDAAVDGCVARKPRSLAALPIRDGGGAIIGVLLLVNKRFGVFEILDVEMQMDFLGAVAATLEKGMAAESKLT